MNGLRRTPVEDAARVAGGVFLVVAVGGFVPGLTTNLYDGLEFAGAEGSSKLLGLFAVSVLHNVVHGLFGLAGLALARTPSGARTFLLGGGGLYLALFLLGGFLAYFTLEKALEFLISWAGEDVEAHGAGEDVARQPPGVQPQPQGQQDGEEDDCQGDDNLQELRIDHD